MYTGHYNILCMHVWTGDKKWRSGIPVHACSRGRVQVTQSCDRWWDISVKCGLTVGQVCCRIHCKQPLSVRTEPILSWLHTKSNHYSSGSKQTLNVQRKHLTFVDQDFYGAYTNTLGWDGIGWAALVTQSASFKTHYIFYIIHWVTSAAHPIPASVHVNAPLCCRVHRSKRKALVWCLSVCLYVCPASAAQIRIQTHQVAAPDAAHVCFGPSLQRPIYLFQTHFTHIPLDCQRCFTRLSIIDITLLVPVMYVRRWTALWQLQQHLLIFYNHERFKRFEVERETVYCFVHCYYSVACKFAVCFTLNTQYSTSCTANLQLFSTVLCVVPILQR